MEVSSLFVVVMGMGITFIGLTCIIFLTQLMGAVMQRLEKKHPAPPKEQPAPVPAPTPAVPAGDGVPAEVKVAIIAALAQTPGFRMEDVTSITIKRS